MAKIKEISNITREKLNGFRGKMKKFGVEVPEGDDVEGKAPLGVKMRATYFEASETLKLEILEKPAFIPEAQIWNIIDGAT